MTRRLYWEGTGRHQKLAEQLQAMIPASGPVVSPNSTALNCYCAAANAYYDIFNNGGGNRADEIREIFGNRVDDLLADERPDFKAIPRYTERKLDRIILAAAIEQGIYP